MSASGKQRRATGFHLQHAPTVTGPTLLGKKWPVLLLAFIAFAWAIIASHLLFPFYTNNHDEGVYVFQAKVLAEGKLFLPANQHNDFFKAYFTVNKDNRAIFKYAPVHAAFLALGLFLFGSMQATLGFVAAGNVLLLYLLSWELYRQSRLAIVAAAFCLFSPFFLIQSATFLSYTTALLLHLSFAVLLLRGFRRQSPLLLFGAGFSLGLAFFARPYDAILFAIPLGVLFVGLNMPTLKRSKNLLGLLKQGAWMLLGFSPVFGLVLAYNSFTTGHPFYFPYWLWDPQDTPGFGIRGHRGDFVYDLPAAVEALRISMLQFNVWIFGGSILLGLVLWQLITHRICWRELSLLLLLLIFPIGYFFHWGSYSLAVRWGDVTYLGPRYYLPSLVPVVILGAQAWLNLSKLKPILARFLIIIMLLVSGGLLLWHIAQNYAYTREYRAIYRPFIEQQLDQALVFLPPLEAPMLIAPFTYLQNSPTLDGPVLYAVNRDNQNFTLLDAYPERTPYRFEYYGPYTKTPNDNPETALVKLKRRQVDSFAQRLKITNPTDNPYIFIEVLNNGQAETYLLDDSSTPGKQYAVEWNISSKNIEFKGDYHQHLASITNLSPADKLVISVAFTDNPERQTQQVYERRYNFRLTDDNQLDILLPAEEWYNSFWPVTDWLMGDIDEVITDK
jgi:4-amino-4-deoxy-L-arabinose transferase-like glycosyltransferase